jgi:hypothetical protein
MTDEYPLDQEFQQQLDDLRGKLAPPKLQLVWVLILQHVDDPEYDPEDVPTILTRPNVWVFNDKQSALDFAADQVQYWTDEVAENVAALVETGRCYDTDWRIDLQQMPVSVFPQKEVKP